MITRMSNRMMLGGGMIEWSDWVPWTSIPYITEIIPEGPGVYEVVRKSQADGKRLQIGKTIRLRVHLPDNLLGDLRESAVGGRIMAHEDVTHLLVRWAETQKHHATKRELVNLHLAQFGCYPEYDDMHSRSTARLQQSPPYDGPALPVSQGGLARVKVSASSRQQALKPDRTTLPR
jgi:hypothetical protein